MALNAGDADCTTGLSERIYKYWTGTNTSGAVDLRAGFSPDFDTNESAKGSVKSLCWAVARGVVDEINANL